MKFKELNVGDVFMNKGIACLKIYKMELKYGDVCNAVSFSGSAFGFSDMDEVDEAVALAQKAVEKQKAARPRAITSLTCPSCGAPLSEEKSPKFCRECGQKIIWDGLYR